MRVLGIDEAGRGCVLGDLVVAGFVVEDVEPAVLRAAGADDSKRLTPEARLAARARLAELGRVDVRRVSPAEIDAANLNGLEEAIIADLVRRHRPDRVIVDALGAPATFRTTLARLRTRSACPASVEWVMEVGADASHPEVGAASVFAKTHRDEALDLLRPAWEPFGSGYPSDPITRRWLEDWARSQRPWPAFVRTRWHTVQAFAQPSLFPG